VLRKIEQSQKPKLLTTNPIQSQETSNNSIVENIPSFPMHPHMTYLVKLNQSYRSQKTVRKRGFQQKVGNRFGVEVR
jgi:hypothetical protein